MCDAYLLLQRLTDANAYMTFLEVQLERVSAAFLSLEVCACCFALYR
jgi:hypothetical protein